MSSLPRIFGWSADYSGCGFYRIELPLREYIRRGGEASWNVTMSEEDRNADVIIGQRVCNPGPSRLWQRLCQEGRATMVFEIDDDLFTIDPSNRTAYLTYNQPGMLDRLKDNIRAAHVVTVTNEPLAELMRQFNENVFVVPNRVPAWLVSHERERPEHLTIGWAGSGTHTMDWADAAPQVARFLRRNQDVRAHVVGAQFKSMRGWPEDRLRVSKWADRVEDYYKLLDFDIGLAPLKPHVFNRSKSWIKALEMAALEIPVVASDVGPYSEFVRHGETGYLVQRDHEWPQYLRALASDRDLREELGRNARKLASEHTIEDNLGSWLAAWGVHDMEVPSAA